ncbi:MAG: SDR family oxidoreductase [Bacteroidales bacterium]|nr:SDR family oxidoreductase [Bacteroidales bacterium]
MDFKDKVVWITGASSGIGEALAYSLANEKSKLIISSYEKDELNKVKDNCLKLTKECYAIVFNLLYPEEILKATKEVLKKYDKIDILINNGGISQRSLIIETPIELDRKIMEINYFGGITLTKAILPSMIKNNGGHIVVTSSISGRFGFPLRSAYAASKHAIYGFYETLRTELYKDKINVTIVCPGRIKTNISRNALTKNGSSHGIMDAGQEEGISVEKCAKKIIRAIKKNKKEVLIGGKEILMVYIKRFFPRLFNKIVLKINPT